MTCRFDRETGRHLTREHRPDCTTIGCPGCQRCRHDADGNPIRHCRTRTRCTSHLTWGEYTCPTCLSKIRNNLTKIVADLALMSAEATLRGINSEPANLAGPHADYVRASWRLVNAVRNGIAVEELDMRDPYTCLTMHERTIREDLGHDQSVIVSPDIAGTASYLSWVLTDLARDEEQAAMLLPSLLADTAKLRGHTETALLNSRTPERGIPCPACVTEGGKDAPRLVRHYGHWCEDEACEEMHYSTRFNADTCTDEPDTSGDVWRCPDNWRHEWTDKDYRDRLEDRRKGA